MENNDSRLLHVPKAEFVKVMREIVFGNSGADVAVNNEGEEGEEDENVFVINADEYSEAEGEPKKPSQLSRFSFFGGNKRGGALDSPRSKATRAAQGDQKEVKIAGEKKVERITTLTSRSIMTGRNGPADLTQRKTATIKKGRVKSDSLYFLQKSLEERESNFKSTTSETQVNSARKPKYLYGKEDFFSSDTDMSVASRL